MIISDIQNLIQQETKCTAAAAKRTADMIDKKYRGLFSHRGGDDPATKREKIRELHKNGVCVTDLAEQYRLHPATIKRMIQDE